MKGFAGPVPWERVPVMVELEFASRLDVHGMGKLDMGKVPHAFASE